jgi:regulation of enolase protein 1 (concanavalin A-like superfamily)
LNAAEQDPKSGVSLADLRRKFDVVIQQHTADASVRTMRAAALDMRIRLSI